MIELERTFLAKYLPIGLEKCESKEIFDIYVPKTERHPILRIRKAGKKLEITKKHPVADNPSEQREFTISLTENEFEGLSKIEGKRLHKIRYYFPYKDKIAEIDVFLNDLAGLALVDFEFENAEEKNNFKMPDFCLADVTQEEFLAGGMLCGKKYAEIEKDLGQFGYKKICRGGGAWKTR